MKYKAILFDLDGTLLPQDQEEFVKYYFKTISARLAPLGYEPERLIKTIWQGTGAMIKNNGVKSNEQVFWDVFLNEFGSIAEADMAQFDEYYKTDFNLVKEVCGFDEAVPKAIRHLKDDGYRLVVATNPIFPEVAIKSHISWAGLDCNDFELITTYENSYYCKPNPKYYQSILKTIGLAAEDCLMVGNDVSDDMVAENIGMDTFLITRNLINKYNAEISGYQSGDFDDLIEFLNET